MNLGLYLKTRRPVVLILLVCLFPFFAGANPLPESPRGKNVTDLDVLSRIGIEPLNSPVWCYNDSANSILLLAPAHAREQCELSCEENIKIQEKECRLTVGTLNIQIKSLEDKYTNLLKIKDEEINALTEVATETPNSNGFVLFSAGTLVGIATTLLIMYTVK